MKINWKVRVKNPYFWVGLLGVILSAMGVSADMFTSWDIVIEQAKALISTFILKNCFTNFFFCFTTRPPVFVSLR